MKAKNSSHKKWYSASNIIYGIIMILLITLIASPDAKSWAIRNMMKVGLFQPDIPTPIWDSSAIKSGEEEQGYKFIVKDEKGNTVTLSSLKGKVVFINFWATWCPPCRAEMPTINTLYHQLKNEKDVVLLLVDMDEGDPYSKVKKFMEENKFDMPVYFPSDQIPSDFFSGALPTTVILDKSGNIALQHAGAADYSNPKIAKFIRALSNKDKSVE